MKMINLIHYAYVGILILGQSAVIASETSENRLQLDLINKHKIEMKVTIIQHPSHEIWQGQLGCGMFIEDRPTAILPQAQQINVPINSQLTFEIEEYPFTVQSLSFIDLSTDDLITLKNLNVKKLEIKKLYQPIRFRLTGYDTSFNKLWQKEYIPE